MEIVRVCNSYVCKGKHRRHRKLIEGVEGRNTHNLIRCQKCGNVRTLRPVWK